MIDKNELKHHLKKDCLKIIRHCLCHELLILVDGKFECPEERNRSINQNVITIEQLRAEIGKKTASIVNYDAENAHR